MAELRNEWRKQGFLTFLFIFTTLFILLIQFTNPTSAAASSSQSPSASSPPRRMLAQSRIDRVRKSSHISSSPRRRVWKTLSASPSNSSRNSRQVPEIPALYSAPKIQTPDIPALYSAPKPEDAQENELDDQQIKATTEITIGEDSEEEEEEASSEDYQYGVPTEKNPRMMSSSDDSNQDDEEIPNEYPTDSPIPQATYLPPVSKTNDVEFDDDNASNDETTEDSSSSSGGYGNGEEPSPQYGPPQANNRKNGNGGGNGANKRKMQGSSSRSSGNNRRPSDQQQIENSLQPMTRHHQANSGSNADPAPGYLPPVYQPPTNNQQQDLQENSPPQQQREQQKSPKQQQETFSNNGYSSNHGDEYGQQPPNSNYHTLPEPEDSPQHQENSLQDLGQEGRLPPQSQGQYFGNSNQQRHEQPNTFYGPPSDVNHFHQQQQQLSTGNNIVSNTNGAGPEEDELEGLNEKIVDAELLERVQQIIEDHEKQQKEQLDKIQKDNENAIFSSSGRQGYDEASGSPFAGNELSSGDRDSAPYPYYGPPPPSPSTNSHNGYSNPNSGQPTRAYLPPSRNSVTKNLSPDVQVQKAVLSRHFTETESGPASAFANNDRNSDNSGYKSGNQLNSVAGPGPEYLPPSSKNLQNPGYSNSFRSGGEPSAQAENGGGYSVKVGAGITVADNNNNVGRGSTSGGSSIPGSVYGVPSALSSSAGTGSQDSGEFHARQDGRSSSPGVLERFPPQYPAPSQQQHQNFPSSEFWSRTSPQQSASPSGPGTKYGTPSSTFFSSSSSGSNNNNGNSPGQIRYSNEAGDSARVNSNQPSGDYNQRSSNRQQASQYLPPPPPNSNSASIAVPRPVYGVPLAPVITLDSDNNLQNNFNRNGNNNNNNPGSGSPGATNNPEPTSNYYLPPSAHAGGIGQYQTAGLFNSLNLPQHQGQQQESPGGAALSNTNHVDEGSYGFSTSSHQSPTSSSSAYLMIQGHNGISNAFSLPIYDYSPSHQNLVHEHELLGSANSPVVFPFEQLLQQQQHQLPPNVITLPGNFPTALFYNDVATRRQDNIRVSRRALSRKASISPSFNNPDPKQQPILSTPATFAAATTATATNRKRTNANSSNRHNRNSRKERSG